jgi:hypothetical protein
MTQLGEGVCVGTIGTAPLDTLFVAVTAVTFESGIKIFDVEAGGAEVEIPAAGNPHWGLGSVVRPAVYVRQGGLGETKDLKVRVEWSQTGHDGAAKIEGRSVDGSIVIQGDFNISGQRGAADVAARFTTKPDKVTHLGGGIGFEWKVSAGADTAVATGGSPLKLFFVDAKPKPINWSYAAHYLKIIDWVTTWASGKQGEAPVLAAIWDQFSDGTGARVPHVTGFVYWKTNFNTVIQVLPTVFQPDGHTAEFGWSCTAIAHTFMACLAVNGITCKEVVVNAPPGMGFLVHNWDVQATPVPNWAKQPDRYYAGTWSDSDLPPLKVAAASGLKQQSATGPTTLPLVVDMKKRPGVPAQGQRQAPLMFRNHWIVEVNGSLYDTSYGAIHANSMTVYAKDSLAGWLVNRLPDTVVPTTSWLDDLIEFFVELFSGSSTPPPVPAFAWQTVGIASYTLAITANGYHN